MYWVPGSRSSAVGTNGASTIASREVIRELARLMVGWEVLYVSAR